MVISKYLDSIEGTEQEQQFIQCMSNFFEMEGVSELLDKPGIGKIFTALDVLGKSESVTEFKETEHYNNIKNWGISVFDLEKGMFSVYPGPKHIKGICTVAGVIGAGLLLFKLCKSYLKK